MDTIPTSRFCIPSQQHHRELVFCVARLGFKWVTQVTCDAVIVYPSSHMAAPARAGPVRFHVSSGDRLGERGVRTYGLGGACRRPWEILTYRRHVSASQRVQRKGRVAPEGWAGDGSQACGRGPAGALSDTQPGFDDTSACRSAGWRVGGGAIGGGRYSSGTTLEPLVNGHRKSDTLGPAARRERSDRSGAGLETVAGAHEALPPSPGRWADRARAAVGWIALESSA